MGKVAMRPPLRQVSCNAPAQDGGTGGKTGIPRMATQTTRQSASASRVQSDGRTR